MICIIDYGAGNIFSVKNSLDALGVQHIVSNCETDIKMATGLILPGVGAFPDAMNHLKDSGLINVILETLNINNTPFLGICLGMQLLFEEGFEFQQTNGLGLLKGTVEKMQIEDKNLFLPHIGWNELIFNDTDCPLLYNLPNRVHMYFVHSYQAVCNDNIVAAYCHYGNKFPALVWNKKANIFGAQFHPEKSGKMGLHMLKNFISICD